MELPVPVVAGVATQLTVACLLPPEMLNAAQEPLLVVDELELEPPPQPATVSRHKNAAMISAGIFFIRCM